jgi:hypothetical protein
MVSKLYVCEGVSAYRGEGISAHDIEGVRVFQRTGTL